MTTHLLSPPDPPSTACQPRVHQSRQDMRDRTWEARAAFGLKFGVEGLQGSGSMSWDKVAGFLGLRFYEMR